MTTQTAMKSPATEQADETREKTDPASFEIIARTLFAPAYPVIAEQIIEATGIRQGFCLDIGCGGGHLGLAVAAIGDFDMGFMDPSEGMRDIAALNTVEAGIAERARILEGRAENIPLSDDSVDLAISRGSVFFWHDQAAAFTEIHRVLTPGGMAYIGGGFGSAAIKEDITRKMNERSNGNKKPFHKKISERLGPDAADRFRETLKMTPVRDFTITQSNDKGLWIIIRKGECHASL
jgi:ubiquinone/menaquinone biosynthesis C-methylase UbiE